MLVLRIVKLVIAMPGTRNGLTSSTGHAQNSWQTFVPGTLRRARVFTEYRARSQGEGAGLESAGRAQRGRGFCIGPT